ncbi:hypothetical protein KIH75_09030 [Bifidobacterium sp. 64T4]|uniref:RCC1 domain-containing protein n=1 Tax=Bifidobacterium pongonis TaxID=2834432 RepID=UPI001C577F55|nr:hypothetical protein [Bifidobacterium pongonis]MBW3095467.1 hypothetical protein [Bifidobacterium pongonis]
MRCECGEPIEPGQKFCIGCGKELGDSSPSDKTAVLPPIVPDEPVPSPQPKKKRSWHKVVIAIVVVIALILAGVLGFVWLWPKDSTQAADKDTVHYSDTKASKVHRKTVIVLYGKDGKPLEKYELKVKDEDGKVTSHSVKDGQFTPESIGMKPDKQYSVVVSGDPDNTYNLPKINVRPDNEAADDIHDNKLDVKPSEGKDSAGEASAACTKKTMYLSYYDVISSLQKKYGEGEIVTDSGAEAGYLHGLSVVLLIDSDGDGEEDELITVYDNENRKNDEDPKTSPSTEYWTVQTWNYDSEKGKALAGIEREPVHDQQGDIYLELASDENDEITLADGGGYIGSDPDLDYTEYLLSRSRDVDVLGFADDKTFVLGEDTLSQTQETIETIKQGMMTDCNVSSDASEDSSKVADDVQIAVGGTYANGYVLRNGEVWAIDESGKATKMTGLPTISKLFIGGFNGNYALAKDGSLWAWGNPSSIFGLGSLGDGNHGDEDITKQSGKPVKVHNLKNVRTMYSGQGKSYAVLKDGTAWMWGDNCPSSGCSEYGGEEILEPKQVDGLKNVIDFAGWYGINYALKSDGSVLRWIDSKGTAKPDLPLEPTEIFGLAKIKSMSIGYEGIYFLDEQGKVWTSRAPSGGETTVTEATVVNALPAIKTIKQIDANQDVGPVSYFIGVNGDLWAHGANGATCGDGNSAALGDGTCTASDDPVQVKVVSKVRDVTSAWGSSWAITDNGDLYQWGTCNGSGEKANIPKKIESGTVRKIYAAAVPSSYLMMVKKDGTIWGKSVSPTGDSKDFIQIQGIK